MSKKLLLATIASVLTINAFAETTSSTVTSKNYVDAKDALKQNLIEATEQNYPAGSVVETTDEDGAVTQRGICDADANNDDDCDDDFLVTRDVLGRVQTTVTKKTCYQYSNGDCILWELEDIGVYGGQNCAVDGDSCGGDSQCCSGYCVGCHSGPCEGDGHCGLAV